MTAAPKRHGLRFSLRTMFVLVTLAALWLGWELSFVRQRRAVYAALSNDPSSFIVTTARWATNAEPDPFGIFEPPASIPLVRRLLGDEAIQQVTYPPGSPMSYVEHLKYLFPEAEVIEYDFDSKWDP